jgi:uncharacterized protein involved in response to NO
MTLEGVRLFFPLAAAYAVLVPLSWVSAFGFQLPFARAVPVTQWHAHEMIFGVFGAALAGFLTSAVPEWTDTLRPSGRGSWRWRSPGCPGAWRVCSGSTRW